MMQGLFIHYILIMILILPKSYGKYVEGELNTSENWAFLARFCFLSEEGRFDYYIEYNEEQGEPNVLLYYDADHQWPAVYKTSKQTCTVKEAVLQASQIVNLTTRFPFREVSGCVATQPTYTTSRPKYTLIVPTLAQRKTARPRTKTTMPTTTSADLDNQTESSTDFTTTISNKEDLMFDNETILNVTNIQELYEVVNNTETTEQSLSTISSMPLSKSVEKRSAPYRAHYKENRLVVCKNARKFQSVRERWWFIAVSNCNGNKGIHIKYKILMTNGPSGDYWHEHFSADEFYVLPILMAFTIAYSFLILAIVVCSIELKSRQLLHTTYKLFSLSVMVQFFGILFKSLSFLKYAVNGIGAPGLKTTGAVFTAISETCFLLLLLLLSKGYTITRGRLPLAAGVKLTIFMCLYAVTFMSLFIYEAKVFDPGEVLYIYESPAGYGLIVLRIGAWCMFIYSTVFTLKHYPEKSNFFYPFNVFGTLWFLAGPSFILCANTYIDKWVRESIVCAVLLFITFGGHLMFLLLTMPSVANKNFPYHVRTTQIGIMETAGHVGNSSIEQFGHHVYEPTTGVEQTVIVPLSRRTEEIFGGLYSQHMHTTIRQPYKHTSESDNIDSRTLRNGHDMIMENVMSWSLAKNFSALDAAHFDKVGNSNRASGRSNESHETQVQTNGHVSAIANGIAENGAPEHSRTQTSEWVKEVPVELFTISKMVVTKQQFHRREEDSD